MIVRGLDENHDWLFGNGKQDYRVDEKAIEQDCQTRLLSFLDDCFFDTTAGIDWWNLLGRGTKDQLLTAIKGVLLNTEGVAGVSSVDVDLIDRVLKIKYSIVTQYSSTYQNEINLTV